MIDINVLWCKDSRSWWLLDKLFTAHIHDVHDLGKEITITSEIYNTLHDDFWMLVAIVAKRGYALSMGVTNDMDYKVSVLSDKGTRYVPATYKYYVQFDEIKRK